MQPLTATAKTATFTNMQDAAFFYGEAVANAVYAVVDASRTAYTLAPICMRDGIVFADTRAARQFPAAELTLHA
jgi:hypothetical protein